MRAHNRTDHQESTYSNTRFWFEVAIWAIMGYFIFKLFGVI